MSAESLDHASSVDRPYSIITVITDRQRMKRAIQAASTMGCQLGLVIAARGTMMKQRLGFFRIPVSADQEKARILVLEDHRDRILSAIVNAAGLNVPGAGAIYAVSALQTWCHKEMWFLSSPPSFDSDESSLRFHDNLYEIIAILQRGKGDVVAQAALASGAPGPSLHYGLGHGIRDRLGLIRIAIAPEKEQIEMVVSHHQVDAVFDTLIQAGKLGLPGAGFISYRPVAKAMINVRSAVETKVVGASMEQVIAAIDDLKGHTEWRTRSLSRHSTSGRKYLRNLTGLNLLVDQEWSEACIDAIMQAGAGGATIATGREIRPHGHDDDDPASGVNLQREMALIEMSVAVDQVNPLVEAIAATKVFDEPDRAFLYATSCSKAFTYMGEAD